MNMKKLVIFLPFLLCACPDPESSDAGPDAGMDAGVDAGVDAGMDAGMDAG
jgi:endoglucanase